MKKQNCGSCTHYIQCLSTKESNPSLEFECKLKLNCTEVPYEENNCKKYQLRKKKQLKIKCPRCGLNIKNYVKISICSTEFVLGELQCDCGFHWRQKGINLRWFDESIKPVLSGYTWSNKL